jgi:hypothetical protein
MDLKEAIQSGLELQLRMPDPASPLRKISRYLAEVYLLETPTGPAFVWLTPDWHTQPLEYSCGICYSTPQPDGTGQRWVDNRPRHGDKCLDYLSPVILERLGLDGETQDEYSRWTEQKRARGSALSRDAAWRVAARFLGNIAYTRVF